MSAPLLERALLKPLEVASQLGISRSLVYKLIAAGQLEAIEVSKSLRVPPDAVTAFVQSRRQSRRHDPLAELITAATAVTERVPDLLRQYRAGGGPLGHDAERLLGELRRTLEPFTS